MPSLKASAQGKALIKQARNERGWTIDNQRWLQQASQILDPDWTIALAEEQIWASGVSGPTWKRFCQGKPINSAVFKTFCQVLDLDWVDVIDRSIPPLSVEPGQDEAFGEGRESDKPDNDLPQPPSPSITTVFTNLLPHQNLPPYEQGQLIGRQQELEQLLGWLQPQRGVARISIEGIGGVGKTSLALEAAYRCAGKQVGLGQDQNDLHQSIPPFNKVIFTSAQPRRLTPSGILARLKQERTLYQILRSISLVLNCTDCLTGDSVQQTVQIYHYLSQQTVLLIVDNLETIENPETILAFLYDLPRTVKTIVTSRTRTPLDRTLRLEVLSDGAGLELITHQAQLKQVNLTPNQCQELGKKTGGIPAAIGYALGQLANGYRFGEMLPRLGLPHNDFCQFYLQGSVQPLQGHSAYRLLMAAALFLASASREAMVAIAEPSSYPVGDPADDLARLQQLSLVREQEGRYYMLPLTRDYLLAELGQNPELEQHLRHRWIGWAIAFLQEHGSPDWGEWSQSLALAAEGENLCAVVEWCIDQGREVVQGRNSGKSFDPYESVQILWCYLKGWAHFQGYWENCRQWLDWLIKTAQERDDLPIVANALFDQGRILALGDQPDSWKLALAQFERAWQFSDCQGFQFQFNLAATIVGLCLRQEQENQAKKWLEQAENLLVQSGENGNKPNRSLVTVGYYQAQLNLIRGQYEQAKAGYLQVLKQAEGLGWQRGSAYIRTWLVQVALRQKAWSEADLWVREALQAAQANGDKRCIAMVHRLRAELAQALDQPAKANEYASIAQRYFKELGMEREAQALEHLVRGQKYALIT